MVWSGVGKADWGKIGDCRLSTHLFPCLLFILLYCYGLNCISGKKKKIYWSPNPQDLWMCPYLETQSLLMHLVKMGLKRVGWAPNLTWLVSLWDHHHVKTATHTENSMLQRETGVMQQQAKEGQRSLATHEKLGEGHGTDSSSLPSEESNNADILGQKPSLQNCEVVCFCCLHHAACSLWHFLWQS